MEIDVLQFDEKVGLGTFYPWLAGMDWSIQTWRCDLGQLPPAGRRKPLLLLGGYMGVNDRQRLPYLQSAADWIAASVTNGQPLLAICLGGQLLAHALGGKVESQYRQEKGIREIVLTEAGEADPLFAGLPNPFISFEWHTDSFECPPESVHLASTDRCSGQAFRYENAWGVQFHPEVDERVVADWCRRTGSGEGPLEEFHQYQEKYFLHAKLLLDNYLQAANKILA